MKLSLLILVLFISCNLFAQGPWPAGKNRGYAQLLFNTIPEYSTLYSGNGTTTETERSLTDKTVAAYFDYGLSDRFTLTANVPYVFTGSGDLLEPGITPVTEAGNLNGLGNVSFAGKYTFLKKRLLAAFILQADLPTSSFNNPTGLSTGVDALTIMPKLTVGGSKNDWFLYGYFGYGVRNNDYNHILNYGVEGGIKASDKISIILNINSINALENGNPNVDTPTNLATGFYTSIQEFNAFLLKLYAEKIYDNFGGLISIGGGSGNSVAVSPAISFGVFYKW